MFDYLAGIYNNPYRVYNTKVKYNKLYIKYKDSFITLRLNSYTL